VQLHVSCMRKKCLCIQYHVCVDLNVLQGCYDAGVIYLKANAVVLIAHALVIALFLVCNILSSEFGSICFYI